MDKHKYCILLQDPTVNKYPVNKWTNNCNGQRGAAPNQDKGLSWDFPDILAEFIIDLVEQILDQLIPI